MATQVINKSDLRNFLVNHTNAEAASNFGVNVRTISRWRKRHDLDRESVRFSHHECLSDTQKDLLTACMLGDGHICKKSRRFSFGQKESRKEYVEYVYKTLQPLSNNFYKDSCGHTSWRMYTISHSIFESLRGDWYKNGKCVPSYLKLNEYILSHWYLQDGCNDHRNRTIKISTRSFSLKDVERLTSVIKRDLSIRFNVCKSKIISIKKEHYHSFLEIIRQHADWTCFSYKVDANVCGNKIGASRLNYAKACEIRRLYKENVKVSNIAKMYGVTLSSIYKVINNDTYYNKKNVADVKVIYNPASSPITDFSTPFLHPCVIGSSL